MSHVCWHRGGASFWDSSGINQLSDPFGRDSRAIAISPNADYIGGSLVFFDTMTFQGGTQAGIWSGNNYNKLTLLEELDDSSQLMRLLGTVEDVSDSGWVVGGKFDGSGFIWHESFNGIDTPYLGAQDFNHWFELETGSTLPSLLTSVDGIYEDSLSGDLSFIGSGSSYVITASSSAVPEPSSLIALGVISGILVVRRRR